MNVVNASSRIDVIVHSATVEWWQIAAAFTPPAALLAVAAVIIWAAVRPPASSFAAGAELPAGSWDQTEWALEMALEDNPERRSVGLAVLEQLSARHSLGKEDAKIVAQARALLNPH